ncbi:MAG: AmmeMemoRadiSam system protein B [Planctomycetes bacterium]|nr:AmmeMemoRadiSam system protein B [Planctomycetota bacterium]
MIPTGSEDREPIVRPAAKAGTWYEKNPSTLIKQLEKFLQAASLPAISSPVCALISPHAGYVYSGGTAAYGYKTLEGRRFKRVIVLAPSHYAHFEGGSILEVTHYETPLGRIPLDQEVCNTLRASDYFTSVPMAHDQEHSLELQLPFLQYVLEEPFSLVPVVIGNIQPRWLEPMADLLLPYWDEETLVVTSSDFTHYGANFGYLPFKKEIPGNLDKLDHGAIDRILENDAEGFNAYVEKTGATICGRKPIALLLTMARKKKLAGRLLHYTTSGALTGDYGSSVSYASICFCKTATETTSLKIEEASHRLSEKEEQTLLGLARYTLETFLDTGRAPDDLSAFEITPALKEELGAFVTLKIDGQLRGCIGYLKGVQPLYRAVINNTISAASKDPRFPPVQKKEVARIHMEISVLSPVIPVKDVEEIVVGRDGLIISQGSRRGTLLPQVPVEYGWTRQEFLEHSCMKAGLPKDAYKEPDTRIERYAAQVFSEDEE